MKKITLLCFAVSLIFTVHGQAQYEAYKPASSQSNRLTYIPRAHTQLRVLRSSELNFAATGTAQFNTPAMIRSAYGLPSTGGANAIAIVDAFHYPTALNDFNEFATAFALPKETSSDVTATGNQVLQVVYASEKQPGSVGNLAASWSIEAALDIEWAHAMAPHAKIYLVEAASDSLPDLYHAVIVASQLPNVREVSMSWGSGEFSSETSLDALFDRPGIVFLAATGDSSDALSYPALSPNVVACGGTSLQRDPNGVLLQETAWIYSGCGVSSVESRPIWQNIISSIIGTRRATSDISFVADPQTGAYVYDSTPYQGLSGWYVAGGTSLSTPCLAGVINNAGASGNGFATSSSSELSRIYSNLGNSRAFRDVSAGRDGRYTSILGWDYATGVGTPIGLSGK